MTRAHFRERLVAELKRAEQKGHDLAILWLDLDGFREVNDHFGHWVGDEVLREAAARVETVARPGDLVGRLGGDEFAVLMTGVTSTAQIEVAADRIRVVLREPIVVGQAWIHVSGSMGIAISPGNGTDAETLLRNADTAMYQAKQLGRDRWVYFRAEMNEISERRAEKRHELERAARNREFVVHYQPIVDSTTGAMRMAEALVRWQRDGEVVTAGEFLALAEETGQMRAIGRIALDLIAEDLESLPALNGAHLQIAVNLSATQLEDRETTDWLLAWNPPGGLSRVVFEVTESVEMTRSSRSVEMLRVLQRLGAAISIDDFGTGYSNFSRLDMLRPDIIKIDQSLLAGALTDAHALEVLTAAIHIAQALAHDVVAEGIETQQERELANRLGVQLLQGFHIAASMPIAELAAWGN